jgi:pyruvate kinase
MINDPRPTRAEASDVANAIIDGTDAVMLSGESAVGKYPVRAVQMMARIAEDVEHRITFKSYPPVGESISQALSEAANSLEKILKPRYIAVMTTSGHTAHSVARARPRAPVIAITLSERTYHSLNLFWGIQPLLVQRARDNFEGLMAQAQNALKNHKMVSKGETILVIGGIPTSIPLGANFVKIHKVT